MKLSFILLTLLAGFLLCGYMGRSINNPDDLAPAGIAYYGSSPAIAEWKNSILLVTLKTQSLRVLKLNEAGTEVQSEKIYLDHEDKEELIKIMLKGLSGPLTIKGRRYDQQMPAFGFLSDQEIAYVATYIRTHFGNNASSINKADVAKIRAESKK